MTNVWKVLSVSARKYVRRETVQQNSLADCEMMRNTD